MYQPQKRYHLLRNPIVFFCAWYIVSHVMLCVFLCDFVCVLSINARFASAFLRFMYENAASHACMSVKDKKTKSVTDWAATLGPSRTTKKLSPSRTERYLGKTEALKIVGIIATASMSPSLRQHTEVWSEDTGTVSMQSSLICRCTVPR